MRRTAVAAIAVVLALPSTATAHERHGVATGYVSTVAAVQPNVLGLTAFVVGGDDRLLLRDLARKTVVISGYDGEPYLRFTREGVFENARSPAAYLNRFRYPPRAAPAGFDANAEPRWVRVASSSSYSWHDHRIHWAKRTPPPGVAAAPGQPHKIFDWRVPGTANGKRFAIVGFLGYVPPPSVPTPAGGDGGDKSWPIVVGAVAAGVLALAGLVVLSRGRGQHEEPAAPREGGGLP